MCTKWFSAGEVHKYFNPYESPYEAFINYMNVLSDFIIRLDQYDPGILLTFKPEISEAAKKPARRGRPPSSTKKEPAPKTDRTKKEKKTVEKSETLKQPSQKRTKKK
jgi:alpha-amylase